MNKKVVIGIFILIISILCVFLICTLCEKNNKKIGVIIPEILENTSNITYKIHDNYNQGNYDYTKRGYYTDTLYQPNAPYYYIITMGKQKTGGYSISISNVKIDKENNVEVIVKETKPTGMVEMVLTYPACCLELSASPNSIIIKNTEGEIFNKIEKQDNIGIEQSVAEKIIGQWYPNDIIAEGEEGGRALSSYFGYNINEKNHFEFYTDGNYFKELGELNEKGIYKVVDNKIYMTSDSGKITIAELSIHENESNFLIEKDNGLEIKYLKVEEEWKKINLENYNFYDDCITKIDLDGNEQEESIEIKTSGKFIIINGKEYTVNQKNIKEYKDNYYTICDLNNDNIMEIIHRTFSNMISPITNYYTIYNFYNNKLQKIAEMSFMGNMPDEIYVQDNTIKFEYWPFESVKDNREEVILDLQLNYLD